MDDRAPGMPAAAEALVAMQANAAEATAFLKAIAHEGRLMILCHLAEGEKSVTELEAHLGLRQAAVSQQLARLRADGLVTARRDGKAIHYRLVDPRAAALMETLYALFCAPDPG
ncbi:MAG: metalloregulator ArsR/SmtB family transcription factor [Pseudomonadota bacterium]